MNTQERSIRLIDYSDRTLNCCSAVQQWIDSGHIGPSIALARGAIKN